MKLKVIIEKNEEELWGRIEGRGNFMPATVGLSKIEVLENLKLLILDYQKHEGASDKAWKSIDLDSVQCEFAYDLQAFFEEYNFLKQTKIAELSGLNASLLRQYASGVKFPSPDQALKIEKAVHQLALELQAVSIYAA